MNKLSVEELKKFTKEELIYYLKKIEFYIPSGETESIKYCILNKRHADLTNEFSSVISKITKLLEEYKKTQNIDAMIEIAKLSKERDRLWNKQLKIEKELWGS